MAWDVPMSRIVVNKRVDRSRRLPGEGERRMRILRFCGFLYFCRSEVLEEGHGRKPKREKEERRNIFWRFVAAMCGSHVAVIVPMIHT